jgi:prolyl-tRNA synthetase
VKEKAFALAADFKKAQVRAIIDDDESKGPGFKINEYNLQGVCSRIELGPKDLAKNACVMARRDKPAKEEKFEVPLDQAVARLSSELEQMQKDMFNKAKKFRDEHTFEVNSYDELKKRADDGFLLAHWDGTPQTEAKIKEETGLTTRNRPFALKQEPGKCVMTGAPSAGRIVFSKAY